MPTLAQDLFFARAGLEEVERYLLADELYWPLSGSAHLPRFTIGGLLLSLRRARGRGIAPVEQAEVTALQMALDRVHFKWSSAWKIKCRREVHARLDLWEKFLVEYSQSPESQMGLFKQQVHWRVLLTLLTGELNEHPQGFSLLDALDQT